MSDTIQEQSLQTWFMDFEVVCRRCQSRWQPPIARFVNAGTDPDARLGILLNTMHHSYCPHCKLRQYIDTTFEYYDPGQNIVVQVRPEWEYKAGGGEKYYLKRFEDLVLRYSKTDVRVDVVFGMKQLIDTYLGGDEAIAAAREEWNERRAAAIQRHQERTLSREAFEPEPPEGADEGDNGPGTTA
jgi:hypothetical protein